MQVVGVGPVPVNTTCPNCQSSITTTIERKASTKTHIIAGLLCLFGCWCCVCIPYCKESCKNAVHSCPNCKAFIGSYET